MLNYTINSLAGFACPARFNGASCSGTFKDVPCIVADMVKRGCTITSEYYRPSDDTYVVMCQTRRGIAVHYAIHEWSLVCAMLTKENESKSVIGKRISYPVGNRIVTGEVMGQGNYCYIVAVNEFDRREPWPCQNDYLPSVMLVSDGRRVVVG